MKKRTKLMQLFLEMDAVQGRYSHYGASDTEPDAVFQWCLADYIDNGTRRVPRSISEWQIFGAKDHGPKYIGAGEAARALTSHLVRCYKAIDKANHRDVQALRRELWRA